ncbi:hypothetical protein CHCC20375_1620 [Bacillus licheniformis]|nr:hypothetical protein CHCC20375_1620 [Bacillus licheniformis]
MFVSDGSLRWLVTGGEFVFTFLTIENVFTFIKNKFLRTSFIKNFNAYDTIELQM